MKYSFYPFKVSQCEKLRIRSISGLYFPAFRPEKLQIQTLFMQYLPLERRHYLLKGQT